MSDRRCSARLRRSQQSWVCWLVNGVGAYSIGSLDGDRTFCCLHLQGIPCTFPCPILITQLSAHAHIALTTSGVVDHSEPHYLKHCSETSNSPLLVCTQWRDGCCWFLINISSFEGSVLISISSFLKVRNDFKFNNYFHKQKHIGLSNVANDFQKYKQFQDTVNDVYIQNLFLYFQNKF